MSDSSTSQLCPSEDVFVLMLQHELSPVERAELEEHLDTCAICARLVVELADLLSVHDLPTEASFVSEDVLPTQGGMTQFKGYRLGGVLGAGGMGVVYRARDTTLDREVAIKVIRADKLDGEQAEQLSARLLREAKMLARVNHPNVVTIHEARVEASRVYLVMELIEGGSLDRIQRARTLDWEVIINLYLQVCEGLHAAHDAGVIHRDIKPSNIIVTPELRAVLTDFGLARGALEHAAGRPQASTLSSLTRTGAVLGTPAYMPPEQHLGGVADERSDIFGLCASLYASLFGERPFAGESVEEVALNACSGEVRQPSDLKGVPAQVLDVLRTGMSRRKEDRYASVEDLRSALDAVRLHQSREVWRWAALGVMLCVVAGVSVWAWSQGHADSEPLLLPITRRAPQEVSISIPVHTAIAQTHHAHRQAVHEGVAWSAHRGVESALAGASSVNVYTQQTRHVAAKKSAPGVAPPQKSAKLVEPSPSAALSEADLKRIETAKLIMSRHGKWSAAYMSHDMQGCRAALDGLPDDNFTVRIYRSQCFLIEGRCDEAIDLFEMAYAEHAPGTDVSKLGENLRLNCRPPESSPVELFVWDTGLLMDTSPKVCRTRGAEFITRLEDDVFRQQLMARGVSGQVSMRLRAGLKCVARSKRDECDLAFDMAWMIARLEKRGATPDELDAHVRAQLDGLDKLGHCVAP